MNKSSPVGLYLHIPFCLSKCPYCDFYSVPFSRSAAADYSRALIRNISHYGEKYDLSFDTAYLGGGTPVLLYEHTGEILSAADITPGAEITAEANPCMAAPEILKTLRKAGVNRISFGVQSMNGNELNFLGRRHSATQAGNALKNACSAGFDSVSADLMLGLPGQDEKSLSYSIQRLSELGADHISAYILKIEENTHFAARELALPDDDRTAELYLHTVRELESLGFAQYEISNFAKPGHECRHNLKYWRCGEYLGIGAAAHSFLNGKRFCTARDIGGFISSPVQETTFTDGNAGGYEEYVMLKLRLTEGISFSETERFGKTDEFRKNIRKVPGNLLNVTENGVSLTPEGFLVSNAVIGRIIYG